MEFKKWPKIPRANNEKFFWTEKIDGTNAALLINVANDTLQCQSRSRLITPEDDNYGFARWAYANKAELMKLGDGYRFGEWWGQGIQRGYDMPEKVFSLFYYPDDLPTEIVRRVPSLPVNSDEEAIEFLKQKGSQASPGYMRPEGAVRFNYLAQVYYKIIIDK
jgi:hypothetical protein